MKLINDDEIAVSFDAAAFNRAALETAADVASGRITPAEARKITAEQRRTLKAVELIIKFGRRRRPGVMGVRP
jgi:hypothetical protein